MTTFVNDEKFTGVLCVWEGCLVNPDEYQDFKAFIEGESSTPITVQCLGQLESNIVTNEGQARKDFFFAIDGDISGIVIPRLSIGFKWYEDVIYNTPEIEYLYNNEWILGDYIYKTNSED